MRAAIRARLFRRLVAVLICCFVTGRSDAGLVTGYVGGTLAGVDRFSIANAQPCGFQPGEAKEMVGEVVARLNAALVPAVKAPGDPSSEETALVWIGCESVGSESFVTVEVHRSVVLWEGGRTGDDSFMAPVWVSKDPLDATDRLSVYKASMQALDRLIVRWREDNAVRASGSGSKEGE